MENNEEFFQRDIFGNLIKVVLETEEVDAIGPQARSDFNVFALTDAIGARKKRDAWVLYQKALASGMVAEEIFYKLVWQIKTMLIATKTKSVSETDMKDFPYNKAKSFLNNFKPGEIEKMSEDLMLGYHRARRGETEIETLVEKTLLRL